MDESASHKLHWLWEPTYLQKQLQWAYESCFEWIQWKIVKKIDKNLYFGLFGLIWTKKGPKIWLTGAIFTHAADSAHSMPVNQVLWPHIKICMREW